MLDLWEGVTCDDIPFTVIGLDLANWGIENSIASVIGNLKNLRHFNLANNKLTKSISESLGNLTDFIMVQL
jgi:Leucine-rich repeat (LRR) protein